MALWKLSLSLTRISRPYQLADRVGLVRTINTVCAEGMMATPGFEPDAAWPHAPATPDCLCRRLSVLVASGVVIGWSLLSLGPADISGEFAVGMLAEVRRQGWGSRLLKEALTWTADQQ